MEDHFDLLIHGHKWRIQLVSGRELNRITSVGDGYRVCGYTKVEHFMILLNRDLNQKTLKITLLHELMHAMLSIVGKLSYGKHREEDVCNILSYGLYGVLPHWKELNEWISSVKCTIDTKDEESKG